MPAHSEQPEADISNAVWYLGIDFGTTGVSAVLLNRSTAQTIPHLLVEEIGNKPMKNYELNVQSSSRNS
jgi:activator of 2-hydroxyglutaryl-CoA dehydratase